MGAVDVVGEVRNSVTWFSKNPHTTNTNINLCSSRFVAIIVIFISYTLRVRQYFRASAVYANMYKILCFAFVWLNLTQSFSDFASVKPATTRIDHLNEEECET